MDSQSFLSCRAGAPAVEDLRQIGAATTDKVAKGANGRSVAQEGWSYLAMLRIEDLRASSAGVRPVVEDLRANGVIAEKTWDNIFEDCNTSLGLFPFPVGDGGTRGICRKKTSLASIIHAIDYGVEDIFEPLPAACYDQQLLGKEEMQVTCGSTESSNGQEESEWKEEEEEEEAPKKSARKRFSKGQRDRYRRLVERLVAFAKDDPMNFDLSRHKLPPSIEGSEVLQTKLLETVINSALAANWDEEGDSWTS